MFKTGHLYQNDDEWKSLKLGNSPETIGAWGDLLTSVTMMLNGIGYKETPHTVNEKMKQEGGFLKALLIPSYLPYIWPNCAYHGMERCEKKSSAPLKKIAQAVAAGKPVILQVDAKEETGAQTHFVLVKDKKGDDFVLYDPHRYDGDSPDRGEVLLTRRYKHNGATLESEISAVLWFDFHKAILPRAPRVKTVPVPEDHFTVYAVEDGIALRARPSTDGYPWKLMFMGTELTCLEPKPEAQTRVGVNGQWIRVQDPKGDQGYVAAWFVSSAYYPALDAPPRYALPVRKKWCLNNVLVENPRFETWDTKGNAIQGHEPLKRFKTLYRNTVVNVLKANEIIPGDAESSSRSAIAYQETYRDPDLKKWITTRVIGWVKDTDLDDYMEDEREEFRKFVVPIENQTENSTDAQQYFYIEDASGRDAIRHNMCGELCVAYILEQSIQAVLEKWKETPGSRYNEMVGTADKPLGRPHMEDLFAVHGIEYERYQDLDEDGKPFPYNQLAFADENPRRADQRFASQAFQEKLRDFYFITHLKINLTTGDLKPALTRGERNHWIVVDKVTRNGGRVELYNPFPNKRQEYTFGEFYKAIGSNLTAGWWIRREFNPTFARQKAASAVRKNGNRQIPGVERFQAPIYRVEIENPSPDLTDAEQYVNVEGLKKTNLCGEFCVSFVLTQSMENSPKRWMEKQEGQQAELSELVSWLRAYGFMDKHTKPDQDRRIKAFSIDTVLKYWKLVQPELYNSILGGANNETTGSEELKTILQAYGYKRGNRKSKTPGDFADGGLLASPSRTAEKLKTQFFICGVTIDGNKGGRLVGSIPHWVVVDKITPIGNLVGGNGGWVELYNPFLNRWEEYSYREFMAAYNGGGLWVARDITPTFVPQARVGAKRKERDSQKNGRSGSKKGTKKNGKPEPTQNELVQKGLQRLRDKESFNSVAKTLAKQLKISVKDAEELLRPSTQEARPVVDVEELIRTELQVDSIPPEIVNWIQEQSQGDAFLIQELTNALLEFGILSIDVENKKCSRMDFEDPALSTMIEQALQRGIDPSNSASQQILKLVNVIGPAFVLRAIEGIKVVQARLATGPLEV
jgi:hypothetical protein